MYVDGAPCKLCIAVLNVDDEDEDAAVGSKRKADNDLEPDSTKRK